MDDCTLIRRCQAGQTDLMDILVDRYKKPLYSFCCKLTGNRNEADDLFQDSWVKTFRNIHLCDAEKHFNTWLFTICINLYRDRFRKYSRWMKVMKSYIHKDEMETDMTSLNSMEPSPEENVVKNSQEVVIRSALFKLKDSLRIPLMLYYYEEFDLATIGNMLGIPEGTVKSRLSAGRNELKRKTMEVSNER